MVCYVVCHYYLTLLYFGANLVIVVLITNIQPISFILSFLKPFYPSTADNIVAHTINIVKIGFFMLFGISINPLTDSISLCF